MCVSCNCGKPNDDYGDSRDITMNQIEKAAEAAGTSTPRLSRTSRRARPSANIAPRSRMAADSEAAAVACSARGLSVSPAPSPSAHFAYETSAASFGGAISRYASRITISSSSQSGSPVSSRTPTHPR